MANATRDRDALVGFLLQAKLGQEFVAHRDRAVWSMSYAGGMTGSSPDGDARAVYAFLRLALQHGHEAEPYRGPATFTRRYSGGTLR